MSGEAKGVARRRQGWEKALGGGRAAGYVEAYLRSSTEVLARIPARETAELIEILRRARDEHRRLFVCGNGGSAATASHFAAGLAKEGSPEGNGRFRAHALTDNTAWITSLANDVGYARVFVEQLKSLAGANDVLIAFSSSGNSANVIQAVEWANDNGLLTIGITSRSGGSLSRAARHVVCIDSDHVGHVEEAHFLIQHLVTYYFMEADRQAAEPRRARSPL